MAIAFAIDAIAPAMRVLFDLACDIEPRLLSALISGSRQCGLASRLTSLACGRSLATRRAPFSSQCALLAGCECSFRFGLHGFPFFLSGRQITRDGQTAVSYPQALAQEGGGGQRKVELCLTSFLKLAQPGYMERSRSKCATHSRRLVKLYLARLPFCRGKLHLAQETQHERQARPRRPTPRACPLWVDAVDKRFSRRE